MALNTMGQSVDQQSEQNESIKKLQEGLKNVEWLDLKNKKNFADKIKSLIETSNEVSWVLGGLLEKHQNVEQVTQMEVQAPIPHGKNQEKVDEDEEISNEGVNEEKGEKEGVDEVVDVEKDIKKTIDEDEITEVVIENNDIMEDKISLSKSEDIEKNIQKVGDISTKLSELSSNLADADDLNNFLSELKQKASNDTLPKVFAEVKEDEKFLNALKVAAKKFSA